MNMGPSYEFERHNSEVINDNASGSQGEGKADSVFPSSYSTISVTKKKKKRLFLNQNIWNSKDSISVAS